MFLGSHTVSGNRVIFSFPETVSDPKTRIFLPYFNTRRGLLDFHCMTRRGLLYDYFVERSDLERSDQCFVTTNEITGYWIVTLIIRVGNAMEAHPYVWIPYYKRWMKSALKDGTVKGRIMSEMIMSRMVVKPGIMPDFLPFVIVIPNRLKQYENRF